MTSIVLALGRYSRTTYEFRSAMFSYKWRRNFVSCDFWVNAIFETVTIRIFVNMASEFRKLQFFVNAIFGIVTIRIFANMAYISS